MAKTLRGLFVVGALVLAAQACSGADPTVRGCGSIIRSLRAPGGEGGMRERFESLEAETQYRVYICGQQATLPPINFGYELARQGERTARHLRVKLASSEHDRTILDIIYVFSLMTDVSDYDPKSDVAMMRLLDENIKGMSNDQMRNYARGYYNEILNESRGER